MYYEKTTNQNISKFKPLIKLYDRADIINDIDTNLRAEALTEWQENVDIIFSNLDKNIFYIPGSIKHKLPWGWPDNKNGLPYEIDDLWCISNSKNMDNFSKIYDLINSYIENERCPTYKGISNHMLAFHHLKNLNLIPNKTKRLFCGEVGFPTSNSDYQIYRNKL